MTNPNPVLPTVRLTAPGMSSSSLGSWWESDPTTLAQPMSYSMRIRRSQRQQQLQQAYLQQMAARYAAPQPVAQPQIQINPNLLTDNPNLAAQGWDGKIKVEDAPAEQPAANPAPLPDWLKTVAGIADFLNPAQRGANQRTMEELWQGKSPDWFDKPGSFFGDIERDTARGLISQIKGEVSPWEHLRPTAVGSVIESYVQTGQAVRDALAGKKDEEREKMLAGLTPKQRAMVEKPLAEQVLSTVLNTPAVFMQLAPKPVMSAFDRLGRLLRKGIGSVALNAEQLALGGNSSFGQLDERGKQLLQVLPGDWNAEERKGSDLLSLNQSADTGWDFARQAVMQSIWSGFAEPRDGKVLSSEVAPTMRKVYDRVLMGESPDVARDGMVAPGKNALGDEMQFWQKRVDTHLAVKARLAYADAKLAGKSEEQSVQDAQDAYDEAARFINATGWIPGENNPLKDMIGDTVAQIAAAKAAASIAQITPAVKLGGAVTAEDTALAARMGRPAPWTLAEATKAPVGTQAKLTLSNLSQFVLDPGTKVPVHELFGVTKYLPKRAALKRASWLDTVYDEAAQAESGATMKQRVEAGLAGRSDAAQLRREKAQAVVAAPDASATSKLFANAYLKYSDLVSRTDQSRSRIRSGLALSVAKDIALTSPHATDAVDRLSLLVIQPEVLMEQVPELGNLPKSIRAEISKPAIAEALQVVGKLPSITDAQWNPLRFIAEFSSALDRGAQAVEKFDPAQPNKNALLRFGDGVRSWMGEFYLRWPGYVIRNAASDMVTMATDGLLSHDSGTEVQAWFRRAEVSPYEIVASYNPETGVDVTRVDTRVKGQKSKLGDVPIAGGVLGDTFGKVGEKVSAINDKFEMARRGRAVYSAMRQVMGVLWQPKLSDAAREVMGDTLAQAFEANARGALSPAELKGYFDGVLNPAHAGDVWTSSAYLQQAGLRGDSLSPFHMAILDQGMVELLNRGATDDEVAAFFKGEREKIEQQHAQNVARLGKIISPRDNSLGEAVADIDEYQALMQDVAAQMEKSGLFKPGEALQRVKEFMTPMVEKEKTFRAASLEVVRAIQRLKDIDFDKLGGLFQWLRNRDGELREAYRSKQGELHGAAWEKLRKGLSASEVWDEYFSSNKASAEEMYAGREKAMATMLAGMDALGKGEAEWAKLTAIEPTIGKNSRYAERQINLYRAQLEAMGVKDFERQLKGNRFRTDVARGEMYQRAVNVAVTDPAMAPHVFDVIVSNGRLEQMSAMRVAALADAVRNRVVSGELDAKQGRMMIDDLWNEHFDHVVDLYGNRAQAQILWAQVRNSDIGRRLQRVFGDEYKVAEYLNKMNRQSAEKWLADLRDAERANLPLGDDWQIVPDDEIARYKDWPLAEMAQRDGLTFVRKAKQVELRPDGEWRPVQASERLAAGRHVVYDAVNGRYIVRQDDLSMHEYQTPTSLADWRAQAVAAGWSPDDVESAVALIHGDARHLNMSSDDFVLRWLGRVERKGEGGRTIAPADLNAEGKLAQAQPANGGTAIPQAPSAAQPVPAFYSKLYRAMEQKVQKRATPEELRKIVAASQIKGDEVRWTGFDAWLNKQTPGKPLSKEQVLAAIRLPELEQVTLGGSESHFAVRSRQVDGRVEFYIEGVQGAMEREGYGYGTEREAQAAMRNYEMGYRRSARLSTQYSSYQLPGGENYRELLFKLPDEAILSQQGDAGLPPPVSSDEWAKAVDGFASARDNWEEVRAGAVAGLTQREVRLLEDSLEAGSDVVLNDKLKERYAQAVSAWDRLGEAHRVRRRVERAREARSAARPAGFNAPHFAGNENNLLLHMRVNDRTLPDGRRMLFVEEIQSDWLQQGRDKGFQKELTLAEQAEQVALEKRMMGGTFNVPEAEPVVAFWRSMIEKYGSEDDKAFIAENGTPDDIAKVFSSGRSITAMTREERAQEGAAYDLLQRADDAARERLTQLRKIGKDGVSPAPLADLYHEHAMKRLMRMAAEEGYDVIGWTTGAQQSERWTNATRAVVDEVRYRRAGEDGSRFEIVGFKNEREATRQTLSDKELEPTLGAEMARTIRANSVVEESTRRVDSAESALKGAGIQQARNSISFVFMDADYNKIAESGYSGSGAILPPMMTANMTPAQAGLIREYVDAMNADRFPQWQSLKGDQIVVGGRGFVDFYDNRLVNFAAKYGKQWGAKVGDVALGSDKAARVPREVRAAYDQLVRAGFVPDRSPDTPNIVGFMSEDGDMLMPDEMPAGLQREAERVADWMEQNPRGDAGQEFFDVRGENVHSMDVSPAMKRSVLDDGQSFWQDQQVNPSEGDGSVVRGGVKFLEDGRAVIMAFNSPDVSTLVHELGHVFRRTLRGDEVDVAAKFMGYDSGAEMMEAARLSTQWNAEIQALRDAGRSRPLSEVEQARLDELTAKRERYVDGEENFARAFEDYLSSGEAPTPQLQTHFDKLKAWLTEIYANIRHVIAGKMTPEMKQLFDGMLTERLQPDMPAMSIDGLAERIAGADPTTPAGVRMMRERVQEMRSQAEALADVGRMQTLQEEADRLPAPQMVAQWLRPDGSPREFIDAQTGKRTAWTELPRGAKVNGLAPDELPKKLLDEFGMTPNEDGTGGDVQWALEQLQKAQKVHRELGLYKKAESQRQMRRAGWAVEKWQALDDALVVREAELEGKTPTPEEAQATARWAWQQAKGDHSAAADLGQSLIDRALAQGDGDRAVAIFDAFYNTLDELKSQAESRSADEALQADLRNAQQGEMRQREADAAARVRELRKQAGVVEPAAMDAEDAPLVVPSAAGERDATIHYPITDKPSDAIEVRPSHVDVEDVAPFVSGERLDGLQAAKINGNKSKLLVDPAYRQVIAGLGRYSADAGVADMFFDSGAVSDYLQEAGLNPARGWTSEYEATRHVLVQQAAHGNIDAVVTAVARYAKMYEGVRDQVAREMESVRTDDEAMQAFDRVLEQVSVPDLDEAALNAIKADARRKFRSYLDDKRREFMNTPGGTDTDFAALYARLGQQRAFEALSRGLQLSFLEDGSPKKLTENYKQSRAYTAWVRMSVSEQMSLDLGEKLPLPAEPLKMRNSPDVAGWYLVAQDLLGGKFNVSTNATESGGLQNVFGMQMGRLWAADGSCSRRLQNARALLDHMRQTHGGREVLQGDSWLMLGKMAEEHPGIGFILDPSYFGKPEVDASGKKVYKATSNYNFATEIQTPADLLRLVDQYVVPIAEKARFVLTNEWDDGVAAELRKRGFYVRQGFRGKDGAFSPEIIVFNFDPSTGEIRKRAGAGDARPAGGEVGVAGGVPVDAVAGSGAVAGQPSAAGVAGTSEGAVGAGGGSGAVRLGQGSADAAGGAVAGAGDAGVVGGDAAAGLGGTANVAAGGDAGAASGAGVAGSAGAVGDVLEQRQPKMKLPAHQQRSVADAQRELYPIEREANFWRWFKDSAVVGDGGQPKVVYHGTVADFTAFDKRRLGDNLGMAAGSTAFGFFFAEKPRETDPYNGSEGAPFAGGRTLPVYLSIQNPYKIKASEWMQFEYADNFDEAAAFRRELIRKGYDGIEISPDVHLAAMQQVGLDQGDWMADVVGSASREDFGTQWVAFAPTQIKSIFNRGTYGLDDPNILHQEQARTPGQAQIGDWRERGGSAGMPPSAEHIARVQDAEVEQGAGGQHEPPHFFEVSDAATTSAMKALDAIEQGFGKARKDWKPAEGTRVYKAGERATLQAELSRLQKELLGARRQSLTEAKAQSDFALIDYNDRRGFDAWIQLVAPFSYWGTRSGRNWSMRFLQNPAMLAAYFRYRQAMDREKQRTQVRSRFGSSFKAAQLPGMDVYVDPMSLLFPFGQFLQGDIVNDGQESRTAMQRLYDTAAMMGFRPSPVIDVPLRMSGLLTADVSPDDPNYASMQAAYGKQSIGQQIPLTGVVQGATALAGIGGPTGVDIEAPVRRALGMPEAEPYDAYRITRSVADMAALANNEALKAGQQFDPRPYLVAQQFLQVHKDANLESALRETTPDVLAQQVQVDPALAEAALQIARAAAQQATQQRGMSQLSSSLLGARMTPLPEGEKARWEQKGLERAAAFNPVTGVGSRDDVAAVQDTFPALQVARGQYGALPGDQKDNRYLLVQAQRDQVGQQFDALRDAVIQARPYDRRAVRAIEAAKYAAMDAVSGDQPALDAMRVPKQEYARAMAAAMGQPAGNVEQQALTYRARSIAGATPKEAVGIRQTEVMRFVLATAPSAENFMQEDGSIDFDAYNQSRKTWERNLPRIALGIPQVADVVAQADEEGTGKKLRAWLGTISPADVQDYRSRNDSAVEAAQRLYFDEIYTPVMDEYRKAKADGDPSAWDNTVGAVGNVDGQLLAALVLKRYPDRFSTEDLQPVMAMQMPAVADVMRANMSDSAKAKDAARTAFWDWYRTATPPGKQSFKMKQIPLVSAALDQSSRQTLSTDQYALAQAMGAGWVAENIGQVTPEMKAEWQQARVEREQLMQAIQANLGSEALALLSQYEALPTGTAKQSFRMRNGLVQKVLSLRQQFEYGHPTYRKYYGKSK